MTTPQNNNSEFEQHLKFLNDPENFKIQNGTPYGKNLTSRERYEHSEKAFNYLENAFEIINDSVALKKLQKAKELLRDRNPVHSLTGVKQKEIQLYQLQEIIKGVNLKDQGNYSFTEKKVTLTQYVKNREKEITAACSEKNLDIRIQACLQVAERAISKERLFAGTTDMSPHEKEAVLQKIKPILDELKAALSLKKDFEYSQVVGGHETDISLTKEMIENVENGLNKNKDFDSFDKLMKAIANNSPVADISKAQKSIRKKYVEHKWNSFLPDAPKPVQKGFRKIEDFLSKPKGAIAVWNYLDKKQVGKYTKLGVAVCAWAVEATAKALPATALMGFKLVKNITKGLAFGFKYRSPVNGLIRGHIRHVIGETAWNVKENPYSLAAMGTGMMTSAASKSGAFLFLNPVTQIMFWTGVGLASAGFLGHVRKTARKTYRAESGKKWTTFKREMQELAYAMGTAAIKSATTATVISLGTTGSAWGSNEPPSEQALDPKPDPTPEDGSDNGNTDGVDTAIDDPPDATDGDHGSNTNAASEKLDKAIEDGETVTLDGKEVEDLMKMDTSNMDPQTRELVEHLRTKLGEAGHYNTGPDGTVYNRINQIEISVNGDTVEVDSSIGEKGSHSFSYEFENEEIPTSEEPVPTPVDADPILNKLDHAIENGDRLLLSADEAQALMEMDTTGMDPETEVTIWKLKQQLSQSGQYVTQPDGSVVNNIETLEITSEDGDITVKTGTHEFSYSVNEARAEYEFKLLINRGETTSIHLTQDEFDELMKMEGVWSTEEEEVIQALKDDINDGHTHYVKYEAGDMNDSNYQRIMEQYAAGITNPGYFGYEHGNDIAAGNIVIYYDGEELRVIGMEGEMQDHFRL